jgi:hypothetical protein
VILFCTVIHGLVAFRSRDNDHARRPQLGIVDRLSEIVGSVFQVSSKRTLAL